MIKKLLVAGILVLFLLPVYASAATPDLDPPEDTPADLGEYVFDELLIRFRSSAADKQVDKLLAKHSLSRLRRIKTLDVQVLRLPRGPSVELAIDISSQLPEVEFVEPNYVMRALAPANTEHAQGTEGQWGVEKIQAPEAWDAINPKESVLLAVVDTGIDRYHPDLAANIWQKPEVYEIPDNGVDDDNNGYVDDVWGWDFHNGDRDPFYDYMHGTAVAGTAAGDRRGEAEVLCSLGWNCILNSDHAGAQPCLEGALGVFREIGDQYRVPEPLAGLARVALAEGDSAQALTYVEVIMGYLESHKLVGTDEPFRIYLACYHTLQANSGPRAEQLLNTAYDLLQQRAAKIDDAEQRRSYLQDVAPHRAIVSEFNRQRD